MRTTPVTASVKTVQQPLYATILLLRQALNANGLSAVHQFDLPPGSCEGALVLVDSPLLLFESVALERSAATVVPIHIVLTGDRKTTTMAWGHPASTTGLRLSPASESAIDTLYSRVSQVLSRADEWTASRRAAGG